MSSSQAGQVSVEARAASAALGPAAATSTGERPQDGAQGPPPAQLGAGDDETLPVVDPVGEYEKIKRIGEGTFGVVYKAKDRRTGELVALKRLRMERERDGMPVTSVRELRVLQTCKHPNLVELKCVVTGPTLDAVFLVFEYCPHDLGRLIDSLPKPFHESEVKCLMQQLLSAVAFLHDKWVMHRDLKLSNLLFTHGGQLKLCDYGLARYFQPWQENYTPGVVTLWYRAPEVLLGAETYTEAVDLWSCGCILAELLRNDPLFPGRTEAAMLEMMSGLLGAPSERIWPGWGELPLAGSFRLPTQPYNYLRKEFPSLSDAGVDLLNRLLTYDPERRITARQALRHPYFSERPLPRLPEYMPTFPSAHDAGGGGGAGGQHRQRREVEEAHGRGVKRRYEQEGRDRPAAAPPPPPPPLPNGRLLTSWVFGGGNGVACPTFSGTEFVEGGPAYSATASVPVLEEEARSLGERWCADSSSGLGELLAAVEAGGRAAQVAVAAVSQWACGVNASGVAQYAGDSIMPAFVERPQLSDTGTAPSYIAAFVAAADVAGVNLCVTMAVVDPSTDALLYQEQVHVGAPAGNSTRDTTAATCTDAFAEALAGCQSGGTGSAACCDAVAALGAACLAELAASSAALLAVAFNAISQDCGWTVGGNDGTPASAPPSSPEPLLAPILI
ncbi:cyclin-dependent kinase G-2-like isoform X1 [Micractinium conductrix]|uniref:cyclin-dependent kinase n=1 Tax=Micractinium conductrix TaxID=554055 RepID=A0A2P6V289_9CHLO|nr:cyclin-dependent kinase G-2-like isoform X1 [Micractinium conductrix]|eukprot:PSC68206.1 cyclin-dependent kinase G-2-like isoform X1 [Micractinium conductrix]